MTDCSRSRSICGILFTALAAWGQAPTITSVTNGATTASGGIAPGEAVAIMGANLAGATGACEPNGNILFNCMGTTVTVNGIMAPVAYVSPGEIDVIAPFALAGGSASIVVNATGASAPFTAGVVPASPGISNKTGGTLGLFYNSAGQIVMDANPANPGDVITAYPIGLGLTNPLAIDGVAPPASPAYNTAAAVGVVVGGVPAQVLSAALELGQAGFYQVSFVVPAGLLGTQPVILTADGISSPVITLPLAPGNPSSLSVTTSSDLGTFSIGEVQVGLNAAGGSGSYSWALASGSLPPGISLRGDLPGYLTPSAPEGLIGVATTPGTYSFELSVDSGSSTTTRSFTMTLTALALRDGPDLPDGFTGVSYYGAGYQLSATDNGDPANITCTSTAADGISLSTGCLLSGTPAAAGLQTLPVTFTDGTSTVNRSLFINVFPLWITSPAFLPDAAQNTAYNYTLSAAGGSGTYAFALASPLPAGLTLTGAAISGTPTASPAKYDFSVVAGDSQGHTYTANMAIDVTGTPQPLPQIAQYGDLGDCTIGMGCSRAIGISGGTAPYTWSASGLPPGMQSHYGAGKTLAYVSPGDLELWGAPTALGTYNVAVTATDVNGFQVTQAFPLKVGALYFDNCLITADCPGLPDGTVGVAYASTFRLVGGMPPYNAAQAPSRNIPDGLPAGLWTSPTAVTGIPQESGPFAPLFMFSDSAGSAATLTVPLSAYFNGASTNVDSYPAQYVTAGQSYSRQLAACCSANYTWTVAGGTLPSGLTLSSSGLLSGAPAQAGAYSFLVKATDTGNSNTYGTRQIDLVVTPLSMTAGGALPSAILNTAYSVPLSAGGGAGSIAWTLAPGDLLPPGLSLNASTGAIAGTPTSDGAYAFQVVAADSANHTAAANFVISVFGPSYAACDVTGTGAIGVTDAQSLIDQALGKASAVDDLNRDGKVNVVDIEIITGAVLGEGCSAS